MLNHKVPLLHVEHIEKYYGSPGAVTKALDQVSFDVQAGEFISIMGASGSGKTTLLNCISTIDTVSSGHILLDGQDITTITEKDIAAFRRDYLGFVFQDFNLLDTLTLEENIALPLTISELHPKEIDQRVHRIADKLHISDTLKKFPTQVSGGQKQRCAFARAVICDPRLIMADEPTGALDSNSSRVLLEVMSNFNREMGATILMVTHDAFSASYGSRILFLKDGRIFNEILKGEKNRSTFYHEILDVLMGVLSILFMLAIAFGGIGSTIGLMVTKNVEAGAFDIMILHKGELRDFSRYAAIIQQDFSVQGYSYGIYTNGRTDFLAIHDRAVVEAGRTTYRTYAEFQHDTCMAQSDYLKLRELLGYKQVELNPALCYVHCVPALEKNVRTLIETQDNLECAGYSFAANGVFSESFSQVNDYGNGAGYIIVVPDSAVRQLEVVYGVYAAVTEKPLSPSDLQNITSACDGLVQLDRSSAKSTPSGAPTIFMHEDMDYLSGKWMDKTEFHYLYSMLICLFYLALILEITQCSDFSDPGSQRLANKAEARSNPTATRNE